MLGRPSASAPVDVWCRGRCSLPTCGWPRRPPPGASVRCAVKRVCSVLLALGSPISCSSITAAVPLRPSRRNKTKRFRFYLLGGADRLCQGAAGQRLRRFRRSEEIVWGIPRRTRSARRAQGLVRPGRPRREFAGEVEERILDAASKVFLERGFDGASIDEIAVEAHAGKPTIYARYPGKEALFSAVLARKIRQTSRFVGPVAVDSRPRSA